VANPINAYVAGNPVGVCRPEGSRRPFGFVLPFLQEARRGFVALNLDHWIARVDEWLAQAQDRVRTLDDLAALVRSG